MYLTNTQISEMTYNKLAYAVSEGIVSERRLRDYYTSARKKALSRNTRVSKTTEFGHIEKQTFEKLKDLKSLSDLLHEIHDVNKYLNYKGSTITGLKELRTENLNALHESGFDFVNEKNYGDWINFIRWFKSSEYAKYYDSDDEEIKSVFEQAGEGATPEDWANIFDKFLKAGVDENGSLEVQRY